MLAWMSDDSPSARVLWVDRRGHELGTLGLPREQWERVSISPDGRQAILEQNLGDENGDLWLLDLQRETLSRLTFEEGLNVNAVWSPDSKDILYVSTREGRA